MTQSDLDLLLSMGFEKVRAEMAVKKTGGLQGALNWLEETQDKSVEELQAEQASTEDEGEGSQPKVESLAGGEAKSLVCNECGKLFKNADLATFHANKSGHQDFSESTEEIAPLTEEQKQEKLEDLRQKLQEKRAKQAVADKEDQKRNEKIRMKSTKETQDAKEELERKEQIKEAVKKRQEKAADMEAKRRIKAKIEADKAERKRKADEAKAAKEGRAAPPPPAAAATAAPAASSAPKPAVTHNEARLRLQTANGNLMKTLSADTTLFEVAQQIEAENDIQVNSFTMTFPTKRFEKGVDFGQTLKEAGLVPSAVLIVK